MIKGKKITLGLMGSIILFMTSMLIIFCGTTVFLISKTVKGQIEVSNKISMKVLVDSAYGYIETLQKSVEDGRITLEEAQTYAKDTLAGPKVADNRRDFTQSNFIVGNDGYVWAWTDEYISAMHPMGYEGTNGKLLTDVNGKYVIQDFTMVSKNQDPTDRFYTYKWKNEDETEGRHKIAYVRYFEPWDWNIGIGLYEDEIFGGVTLFTKQLIGVMLFNIVTAILLVYSIFKNYKRA